MARPLTPRIVLERRGSRIRGRHKEAPPVTTATGTPDAPKYLCPLARSEWNRVVPLIEKTLSLSHQRMLAAYCDCVADVEIASRELTQDGQTILDATGKKINHPAWNRKRDARAQMLRYANEFGLTPAAASKIPVAEVPLDDDFDERIFG